MKKLSLDLGSVSKFFLVQADGFENREDSIVDEKEFSDSSEALRAIEESEAPIKYIKFNYDGDTYKLYPIEGEDDFRIIKTPILN